MATCTRDLTAVYFFLVKFKNKINCIKHLIYDWILKIMFTYFCSGKNNTLTDLISQ